MFRKFAPIILVVSACVPPPVSTQNLECSPLEVVTARGLSFHTRAIAGVVRVTGDSAGVPDVQIVVRRIGSAQKVAETTTDASGRFALVGLPDGWYQVESCHPGLNSMVVPVRVRAGGARNDEVKLLVSLSA